MSTSGEENTRAGTGVGIGVGVPVDNRIALGSTQLPESFHADPADRIIVATTLTLGATLITKDDKLRRYAHVETLW